MKKTIAFTVNTILILAVLLGLCFLLIDTTFSLWVLGITFAVFVLKELFFTIITEK